MARDGPLWRWFWGGTRWSAGGWALSDDQFDPESGTPAAAEWYTRLLGSAGRRRFL